MNDHIKFVQDHCTCRTQQSYKCPNSPSGHVSIKAAKFRCCCNSHSLVFTSAVSDIFFLHFPHRSSQETAEFLTSTKSAFCSPEELRLHKWAGQTNVMQLNKPSRELGVICNTARCKFGDTDHSESCNPGGISPSAQEPGKTPKLFMFAPVLGATSVLHVQKLQYCFSLNWNFAHQILIF